MNFSVSPGYGFVMGLVTYFISLPIVQEVFAIDYPWDTRTAGALAVLVGVYLAFRG